MTGYRPEGIDDAFLAAPDATPGPSTGAGPGAGVRTPLDQPTSPRLDQPVVLPRLGVVGWLRWTWRQLTSMRVALMLLMLLAVASVPGSIFPQRSIDGAKVAAYIASHPGSSRWQDRLGLFNVYSSVWFSAIYLLLFLSLIGCILPRTRAYLSAVRARPPRTPRRFDRFPARGGLTTTAGSRTVVDAAAVALRGRFWLPRYRVDVHEEKPGTDGADGTWVLSAERGYLRELGNLVFHLALLGLLAAVGTGQFLHYRGQALVLEGRGFANAVVDYNTFESGAGFDPASLVPFTLNLDRFIARFDPETLAARYFRADVRVREPGGRDRLESIRVNNPLPVGGAKVYLMGNGYAPDVTVRDGAGQVAFAGPVPFLPQDTVYTSRGVIKVPDVSTGKQLGLIGFLLPTAVETGPGTWRSVNPQPNKPVLVLAVWAGDLGLDSGIPQNVYQLDKTRMKQAVDGAGRPITVTVNPGQTVTLPGGLGTVSFDGLPRYIALDLRHDPTLGFVLVFALAALAGLATSLFTPRRRVWMRAVPAGPGRTVLTAAGLARGDDLGLQGELDRVLATVPGQDPVAAEMAERPDAARTSDAHDEGRHDGGVRMAELADDAVTGPEAGR
jgi:cytochrome c biogenesis protein